MALQKETVARRLALRVQYTDDKGVEKFRNLSFAHVAQDATDEHIYAAGKALAACSRSRSIGSLKSKRSFTRTANKVTKEDIHEDIANGIHGGKYDRNAQSA